MVKMPIQWEEANRLSVSTCKARGFVSPNPASQESFPVRDVRFSCVSIVGASTLLLLGAAIDVTESKAVAEALARANERTPPCQ